MTLALLGLLACAPAQLGRQTTPHLASLSEAPIVGLTDVYVSPRAFVKHLRPSSGAVPLDRFTFPPRADLQIRNPTSARCVVAVEGARIGMLPPFGTLTLHEVPEGQYQIARILPDGTEQRDTVQTQRRASR